MSEGYSFPGLFLLRERCVAPDAERLREVLLEARGVPVDERHKFPTWYFCERPNGFDIAVAGSTLDLHVHSVGKVVGQLETQGLRTNAHVLNKGNVAEFLPRVRQVWICEEMLYVDGDCAVLEATERVCKVIASLIEISDLAIYDCARHKVIVITPNTAAALRSSDFLNVLESGIQLHDHEEFLKQLFATE